MQDYIKIDIQETWRGWRVCPGFVGLRIRVSVGGRGGSCEHGSENLGYKKNVGISWLDEELSASEEVLRSISAL